MSMFQVRWMKKKTKTFCTLLLHWTFRVQHLVYVNGFKSSWSADALIYGYFLLRDKCVCVRACVCVWKWERRSLYAKLPVCVYHRGVSSLNGQSGMTYGPISLARKAYKLCNGNSIDSKPPFFPLTIHTHLSLYLSSKNRAYKYFEKLRLKHCDKKRSLIVCHIKGLYTLDIFAHNISIKDKKILR